MKIKDIKKNRDLELAYKCLALYKQGLNLREVGDSQGISHEWVRQLIAMIPDENDKALTGLDKIQSV